jgi:PucR family transcriptional regulator, purine catabolism regulatory protein
MANRFALGDLLDDPELGLELLVGGEQERQRAVRGAHSIEVEHPAAWLERDWVMLTTGIVLRRSAAAQRQLVADLDAKGVAALGFGIGAYFQRVPTALLDEARTRGFPVFAVPFPVGFHQIEGKVHGSLLSSDLRIHARVAALQDHLLDSFADDRPQETLIERLAEVLDASVAIAGPGGRIELSAGKGPWDELWAEIDRRPHTLLDFEVGGWYAIGVPIYGRDAPSARWLLVTRRRQLTQPLTKHAARVATRLLAALTRLHEAERRQESAIRAGLLETLLEPLGDWRPMASTRASRRAGSRSPRAPLRLPRPGPRSSSAAGSSPPGCPISSPSGTG